MRREHKPFAVAVIETLLAKGVQEFVICAGARNSALIVVLAALGDKVRLWQHFDERAASFFAIGRIRATERPVAVVTTSGTAAAELLPAVIEAHYQGMPLVALTADRPKHYRGSGAPQAIEQEGLFGVYAIFCDADEARGLVEPGWDAQRPLHVNVCLDEPRGFNELRTAVLPEANGPFRGLNSPNIHAEPLRGSTSAASAASASSVISGLSGESAAPGTQIPSPGDLILAGDLLPSDVPPALSLIARGSAPVYAEGASRLRDAPALQSRLLRCGDATLRHVDARHILRLGGVPASRYWRDLESRPDIAVTHWTRSGYAGLARKASVPQDNASCTLDARAILTRDAALYARLGQLLIAFPNSEPALFRRLSLVIPRGAAVFTGNSMPVREWNLCAEYDRGHRVHVLRGANGIDGNVSAFLGIAANEPEAWCITGDLTTLYDLNAPWILSQLSAGKRRFVVMQNAGGKIFSRLPTLKFLTERERALMENPHTISLKGWAEMWSMGHVSGNGDALDNLMDFPDHTVIELHPDSRQTEAFWQAWAAAESEVWGS